MVLVFCPTSSVKDDEPAVRAARHSSGSVRAPVQEGMWLLRQHRVAGPVLKVLAGGKSTRETKTDSRWLGTSWEVCLCPQHVSAYSYSLKANTGSLTFGLPVILFLVSVCLTDKLLQWLCLFPARLQREEQEAYASRHQKVRSQPAITPFSKFEERKTKEKSSKVNTVTKFFTPSTKTPPKRGTYHHAKPSVYSGSTASIIC